jgi:phage-related protein
MKRIFWMGSSLKDLKKLPAEVQHVLGRNLLDAQHRGQPLNARIMKHLGPAVYEIVDDYDSNTYRGVFTARFEGAVYVLHVFQKKSKRGIETPQHDIALIRQRLKMAEQHYRDWRSANDRT